MDNKQLKSDKKINPRQKSNIISTLFFCWTLPFFVKGYRRDITENDLYKTLPKHKSKLLGDKLEDEWNKQLSKKRKPSLTKVFFKVFGLEYALYGLMFLISDLVIQLIYPLMLGKLMKYYIPNQTSISKEEAYMWASLIASTVFIKTFLVHHFIIGVQLIGMRARIGCCSMIYRKTLRLSKAALGDTTSGQIINLMSNDVSRFYYAPMFLHDLWASPLEGIIIAYLLYTKLGWTSLGGTVIFIFFIPLQLYLAKLTSAFRYKTAIKTDQRVFLMNEIINGIQVIKMYVWEKPFAKLVNLSRKLEIKQIRGASYIKAINVSSTLIIDRLAIFTCVLVYVLTGNVLQSEYVYVAASYYIILLRALVMYLPQGFSMLAETRISINRIEKFLLHGEVSKDEFEDNKINGLNLSEDFLENVVQLKNVSVKWDSKIQDNTLSDINFNIGAKELVAVVGPVGSGKSTLLQAILKELNLQEGSINVKGAISYASQEPWIFCGSVKQNILFGQKYNETRYKQVIKVCALEKDLSLFEYGDRTIVGEKGVMLSGGQKARVNLARAIYKEADIYLLDDPLSAVDTHVGKQLFNECICKFLKNKCTILVTHQLQYLRTVDRIYFLENGQIINSGTFEELKSSDNDYLKRLELEPKEADEKKLLDLTELKKYTSNESIDEPEDVKEHQSTGKISKKVYFDYIRAGGNLMFSLSISTLFILTQIAASGNDYFLSFWINLEEDRHSDSNSTYNNTINFQRSNFEEFKQIVLTTENCIYIYTGFMCFIAFLSFLRSLTFFNFCSVASKNLHNNMFAKIVFNSMRFFNTNPSGRILNRFSKDMGAIDETLPTTIIDTVEIGLVVLGIVIVVCVINPWMTIPTVVIFTFFYWFRLVYLAGSRDIKRIDGTTRSPILTQLTSSMQGLATIRAFNAQKALENEFDFYQDENTSASYMFCATNRTFGFWLDLFCVIYMNIVTLSFLFTDNETRGGSVGLAITQTIEMTEILQWGLRQWSELENQMTSVERVVEYTELVTECDNKEVKEPTKDWPSKGDIEFKSVSLQYAPDGPKVLKNLNFTINPTEKIGIVGRTGAGKSSLIAALFRLAETEGEIIIDGINTKSVSLHTVRSKISIIPQEPVLFSGTLRKNLDPFDEYEDPELWGALEEVELKSAISELPLGLECNVSEGGSNFSVGQRQLLCLARAAIRSNKILVLDEATANVDPQTDELIQRTIRKKFADCTVLTIAHRLHTVMDSDRILVMDAGQAAEFDHPFNLLENKESIFYGLVKQTGKAMSENLIKIAEKNYRKRNEIHTD